MPVGLVLCKGGSAFLARGSGAARESGDAPIASTMDLTLLRFLISHRLPSSPASSLATDTLTSIRILPFSMSASLAPTALSRLCTFLT